MIYIGQLLLSDNARKGRICMVKGPQNRSVILVENRKEIYLTRI